LLSLLSRLIFSLKAAVCDASGEVTLTFLANLEFATSDHLLMIGVMFDLVMSGIYPDSKLSSQNSLRT